VKSKWTHQLLIYTDEVNLLGDNINTIKKNIATLIDASKEVVLDVNAEKTRYMLLSHYQNAGQNRDHNDNKQTLRKCGTFQTFENDSNRPKFNLGGN
jgi:folylpolyglutamate synthase/dihydropteroate synthase